MKLLTLLPLFVTGLLSAQFTTITYQQKISDTLPAIQARSVKPKKERKPRRTTKTVLKEHVDSLQSLLNYYNTKTLTENRLLLQGIQQSLRKNTSTGTTERLPVGEQPLLKENSEPVLSMPLDGALKVTSPFGQRLNPFSHHLKSHNGIDLRANYQNVYAVLDGTITMTGWDSNGGGNYIKISHGNSYATSYLHLSQILVRTAQYVHAGDLIGISGSTGNSTGPHLHFAVKDNGHFIRPLQFLNDLIHLNQLTINH